MTSRGCAILRLGQPTLSVAKALAASDSNVQELILKRLGDGERLVEVIAWSGTIQTEVQVFFRFVPSEERIHLVDSGILVFVDSTKGEMLGTIDPYELQPEQRVAWPFVSVSPPDTGQFAATGEVSQEIVARERSFFERLGLRVSGGFGIATVIDTIFGTETWSAGRPDDTRSDRTCDYRGQIIIVIR
jgi:hypothetical protein